MTAANLNISVINRRMLSKSEAAQYCGLPVKKFPNICSVSPVALGSGIERYDKQSLDQWLDALSSGDSDSDDDIIGKLS